MMALGDTLWTPPRGLTANTNQHVHFCVRTKGKTSYICSRNIWYMWTKMK